MCKQSKYGHALNILLSIVLIRCRHWLDSFWKSLTRIVLSNGNNCGFLEMVAASWAHGRLQAVSTFVVSLKQIVLLATSIRAKHNEILVNFSTSSGCLANKRPDRKIACKVHKTQLFQGTFYTLKWCDEISSSDNTKE